jgi:hypothetical protein
MIICSIVPSGGFSASRSTNAIEEFPKFTKIGSGLSVMWPLPNSLGLTEIGKCKKRR